MPNSAGTFPVPLFQAPPNILLWNAGNAGGMNLSVLGHACVTGGIGAGEIAILNDVDETTALIAAGQVIDRARGAGTAMSEMREAGMAKLEERRKKREQQTRQRTRERLEREAVYNR